MSLRTWKHFDEEKEPVLIGINNELMSLIDLAREKAGIPFIPTSGVRSAEANEKAGGVPNSSHITGHALDLRCRNSSDCFLIVKSLLEAGLKRVIIGIKLDPGAAGGFIYHNIHCDNSPDKPSPVLSIRIYPTVKIN